MQNYAAARCTRRGYRIPVRQWQCSTRKRWLHFAIVTPSAGGNRARLDNPKFRHGRADDLDDVRRNKMGIVQFGHPRVGVTEVRRDDRQRRSRPQQIGGVGCGRWPADRSLHGWQAWRRSRRCCHFPQDGPSCARGRPEQSYPSCRSSGGRTAGAAASTAARARCRVKTS
jgi:hypothetical protein